MNENSNKCPDLPGLPLNIHLSLSYLGPICKMDTIKASGPMDSQKVNTRVEEACRHSTVGKTYLAWV